MNIYNDNTKKAKLYYVEIFPKDNPSTYIMQTEFVSSKKTALNLASKIDYLDVDRFSLAIVTVNATLTSDRKEILEYEIVDSETIR